MALWKGPALHGCRQGFAWCSLLQWQQPSVVVRFWCTELWMAISAQRGTCQPRKSHSVKPCHG